LGHCHAEAMAEEANKKMKEKDIVGLKYFDRLGELLGER
jgi:hypothetical protein